MSVIDQNRAVEIASRRAKELGYSVEKMTIRSKKGKAEYVVYFAPPTDQLGGDLTVKVDMQTGGICDIIRGQ